MRAIPETLPRRRPRQARAQATVDAIIQATAQILVEQGYDRASTNRVALAAGVSIGSLYQYFPSKEALVAALVEQHQARMYDSLTEVITQNQASTLPGITRIVVAGLIAAYRVDPKLHEVLCQEVPKVGELRNVYRFEERLAHVGKTYLASHRDVIRTEDLERTIFLLAHAVPSVIRAAVASDPTGSGDEILASEITDMVLRYLMVNPPS